MRSGMEEAGCSAERPSHSIFFPLQSLAQPPPRATPAEIFALRSELLCRVEHPERPGLMPHRLPRAPKVVVIAQLDRILLSKLLATNIPTPNGSNELATPRDLGRHLGLRAPGVGQAPRGPSISVAPLGRCIPRDASPIDIQAD